jgi:hypothetical protein
MPEHVFGRCVLREVGAERAAGLDVRHDEDRDVAPVLARNRDIAGMGRRAVEEGGAKRADADPDAACQLEVLVQAAR